MLIDAHAHLDSDDFAKDVGQVVDRASKAGVNVIITASSDLRSCQVSLGLAKRFPGVYAAVGFHPHEVEKTKKEDFAILAEFARNPKVVALGEMGLDFFKNYAPRDRQLEVFRRQLELAKELDLPVVVHSRAAHDETLGLLRRFEGLRGVIHCFSGGSGVAKQYLALGFYISLSGMVTYNASREQIEVIKGLPADRFMVETDCPYLAPVPHRGKLNEPAYLPLTAARVAEIRGEPRELVAESTSRNARRLFGLALPEKGEAWNWQLSTSPSNKTS